MECKKISDAKKEEIYANYTAILAEYRTKRANSTLNSETTLTLKPILKSRGCGVVVSTSEHHAEGMGSNPTPRK